MPPPVTYLFSNDSLQEFRLIVLPSPLDVFVTHLTMLVATRVCRPVQFGLDHGPFLPVPLHQLGQHGTFLFTPSTSFERMQLSNSMPVHRLDRSMWESLRNLHPGALEFGLVFALRHESRGRNLLGRAVVFDGFADLFTLDATELARLLRNGSPVAVLTPLVRVGLGKVILQRIIVLIVAHDLIMITALATTMSLLYSGSLTLAITGSFVHAQPGARTEATAG